MGGGGNQKPRSSGGANIQQQAAPSLQVLNDNYKKSRQRIVAVDAFGGQNAFSTNNAMGSTVTGTGNAKSRKKSLGSGRQPTSGGASLESTGNDRLVYLNLNQY